METIKLFNSVCFPDFWVDPPAQKKSTWVFPKTGDSSKSWHWIRLPKPFH